MRVRNKASGSSSDLSASIPPDDNFEISLQITDKDLGAGFTDALGIPLIDGGISPATDLRMALPAASAIPLDGSLMINIPAVHCERATWLCVHVEPADSPPIYNDSDTDNNVYCLSIDAYRTCEPSKPSHRALVHGLNFERNVGCRNQSNIEPMIHVVVRVGFCFVNFCDMSSY